MRAKCLAPARIMRRPKIASPRLADSYLSATDEPSSLGAAHLGRAKNIACSVSRVSYCADRIWYLRDLLSPKSVLPPHAYSLIVANFAGRKAQGIVDPGSRSRVEYCP